LIVSGIVGLGLLGFGIGYFIIGNIQIAMLTAFIGAVAGGFVGLMLKRRHN